MQLLVQLTRLLLSTEVKAVGCAGTLRVSLPNDPEPLGAIMGEGGRVCWAFARIYGRRFSDLIAQVTEIPNETLTEIILDCQATRRPFGERLLEMGLLSEDQLRQTLKTQTVSAAMELARGLVSKDQVQTRFDTEEGRSYQPRYTFSALELIEAAILRSPESLAEVGQPPEIYTRLARSADAGVCFLETGARDAPPVPVACSDPESFLLSSVLAAYRAARVLLQPPPLSVAGLKPYGAMVHAEDNNWLACFWKPHLCLFAVRDVLAGHQALAALAEESRRRP